RGTSDDLAGLVKEIDRKLETAGKSSRALGAYILFDSSAPDLAEDLRAMAKVLELKRVHLCIGAAPPDYGVSRDADVTVAIYNPDRRGSQKVTANFALRVGELDAEVTYNISAELSKVLPK